MNKLLLGCLCFMLLSFHVTVEASFLEKAKSAAGNAIDNNKDALKEKAKDAAKEKGTELVNGELAKRGFGFLSLGGGDSPASQALNQAGSFVGTAQDFTGRAASASGGLVDIAGAVIGIDQDFKDIKDIFGGKEGAIPDGEFALPDASEFNTIGENDSLRQFILNVMNFILSFLGLLAVAAVIYGGFLYVGSLGDDAAGQKARKIILFAAIGLLVILGSYAFVNTILTQAGIGGDDRGGSGEVGSNLNLPAGSTVVTNPATGNAMVIGSDGSVLDLGDLGLSQQDLNGSVDQFLNDDVQGGRSGLVSGLLGSPLVASGDGVQNLGGASIYTPGEPVEFSIGTQGIAVFDFGDGRFGVLDTISNPNASLSYDFPNGGPANVQVIFESITGEIEGFEMPLIPSTNNNGGGKSSAGSDGSSTGDYPITTPGFPTPGSSTGDYPITTPGFPTPGSSTGNAPITTPGSPTPGSSTGGAPITTPGFPTPGSSTGNAPITTPGFPTPGGTSGAPAREDSGQTDPGQVAPEGDLEVDFTVSPL